MLQEKIAFLVDKVLDGKPGISIAIGIFDGQRRHFYGYGDTTESTLYEIGSITKIFTTTLLACMAAEESVALADPVKNHLPALPDFPANITLERLATHTAGLPALPKNIVRSMMKDRRNPYANYAVEDLMDYLKAYQPQTQPKSWDHIHYSTLGMGLLGLALCHRLELTYTEAVDRYICKPLGLQNTTINMNETQRDRFAQPHNYFGRPTPRWDIPTLAGAGALLSTVADLLTFIEAHLCDSGSRLESAIAATLKIRATTFAQPSKYARLIGAISSYSAKRKGLRFQTEFSDFKGIGLGWFLLNLPGNQAKIWFHNGATQGSRAMIALAPESKTGVVVLTNHGINDLGILFPKASVEEIGLGILTYLNS